VVPEGLRLHFADLAETDRAWVGPVPVTAPVRTIQDCAAAHVPPGLVAQAVRDGLARGLFARTDLVGLDA
jgi:hypothetical protein